MDAASEPRLPKPPGWAPEDGEDAGPSEAEVAAIRKLGEVAVGAELALAGSDPSGRGRSGRALGLAGAAAGHLLLLSLLVGFAQRPSDQYGAEGTLLEGIAVEIVSSEVIESRQASRVGAAVQVLAGEVQAIVGAKQTAPPAEAADPKGAAAKAREHDGEEHAETAKEVAAAAIVAPADPRPPPPDAVTLPVAPQPDAKAGEAVPEPVPEKQEPQADAAPAEQAFRPPSADAPVAGGGEVDAPQPVAEARPAIAAPGDVAALGRLIQIALEQVRPTPIGIKGRVVIEIVVGAEGGLEAASVLKSSGHPRLDQAALAAARRVSYPVPGRHFTRAQRIYHVPYRFQ